MLRHKIGHRGAPREFPANTMRGFARAVERGCSMVECDVRLSSDGVPVLARDPQVTNAQGEVSVISEHSADALHSLDLGAGEGVPTLAELAQWARGRCAIMADMKCEEGDVETKVGAALAFLPPEAKVVPGAGEASRRRFRAVAPDLPLSLSLSDDELPDFNDDAFAALLPTIDTDAVTRRFPLLTAMRIAALQERGLRVYAWTTDDLETMRRLIADGADGLISNRADLLQTL